MPAGARVAALRGTAGAVVAGGTSGFMNAAAGVGGPALSLYAANAGWPVRQFVPNPLFYGVLLNLFSVTANGLPRLSAAAWLTTAAGLAAGTALGETLVRRVPQAWIRRAVMLLSLAGGLTTLVRGCGNCAAGERDQEAPGHGAAGLSRRVRVSR
ncbi:TSUP family transporter [Streptomyces sp. NPDC052301]|uniref:TSUP family transporter n=1 Tax=Streptomyces sp. NPDC052301 TaxID=3365687 RepID=UPI0037CDF9BB